MAGFRHRGGDAPRPALAARALKGTRATGTPTVPSRQEPGLPFSHIDCQPNRPVALSDVNHLWPMYLCFRRFVFLIEHALHHFQQFIF